MQFLKRRGIFLTLLLSNILILLTAVVVGIVSYLRFSRTAAQSYLEYSKVILEQMRSSFDEKVESTSNLVRNLAFSPTLQDMAFANPQVDDDTRYQCWRLMRVLSNYTSIYREVDVLGVYYPLPDLVVTHQGGYFSTEEFLDPEYSPRWNREEWDQLFSDQPAVRYFPERQVHTERGEKTLLTATCPIYVQVDGKPIGYIFLTLDASFLATVSQEIRDIENCVLYAMDQENTVLFLLGNEELLPLTMENQGEGHWTKSIRGRDYLFSELPSQASDWEYRFLMASDSFFKQVGDIFTFTLLAVVFFTGLALAVYLAMKNFRPIREIMSTISQAVNSAGQGGLSLPERPADVNELEYIRTATLNALKAYSAIQDKMARQFPVVRNETVKQLLSRRIDDPEAVRENLLSFGIRLEEAHLVVFMLNYQTEIQEVRESGNFITAEVRALLEDFLSRRPYSSCLADVGYSTVGIILSSPDPVLADRDAFSRMCSQIIAGASQRHPSMIVTIAVGEEVSGLENIRASYISADKCLTIKLANIPGGIVYFDDAVNKSDSYYYPVKVENQLISYVKSGNLNGTFSVLNEVLIENFVKNSLSMEVERCLIFNLIGTALRAINSLGLGKQEGFTGTDLYNRVLTRGNIQDMEVALRGVYSDICESVTASIKKPRKTMEEIFAYINAHYQDNGLGLNSVAQAVGLNPNYLSGYFKENAGENFVNYVNLVRLDKAKELLKATDKSLDEIADLVGYSNSSVLIRNFKKYLSQTPGQYRGE